MKHRVSISTAVLSTTLIFFTATALSDPPKPTSRKSAIELLDSPKDDIRRYSDASAHMGPKPPREVINRIVTRGKAHPEDAEAVYWAAQAGADGLSDDVPNYMEMMRKSADQGFPPAMAAYGSMLCGGNVVARDVEKGLKLLNQACDRDEPTGFYQLGLVYFAGVEGAPRDLDRAEACFKKAVDRDFKFALVVLAKLYSARNDSKHMLEYVQKAAEAGSYQMMAFLAECYSGSGPLPLNDMSKAIDWARRGALLNDPAAMRVYAYLLMKDLPEAKKDLYLSRCLLQRAADLGDNEAAACVQSGKVTGMFGETRPKEGLDALEKMVAGGIVEAKWHLGRTLYGGQGEPADVVDKKRGLSLIKEAAADRYLLAQKFLKVLQEIPPEDR
jgi:TPR repeat protein